MDIDASELNKNRKANLPVVGDIKDALDAPEQDWSRNVRCNKKHTAWLAQIAEWKKKAPFAYRITPEIANSDHMMDHMQGNESEVILQQMVIETLYELTKGDAISPPASASIRCGPANGINTNIRASSSPAAASARWVTAIPPRSA